tara:strand:+ start:149 stop:352 length:204 start_codon:yes stop_codon:yes gene_type:complete
MNRKKIGQGKGKNEIGIKWEIRRKLKDRKKNWEKFQKITFETIRYGNKKKEIRMGNQNGKSENKKKK